MDFDWGPVFRTGGLAGAGIAALGLLARGLGWLLRWNSKNELGNAAEVRAREAAVTERERAYVEKVDSRMAALEADLSQVNGRLVRMQRKFTLLRGSLIEVTVELRVHAPESEALIRAEDRIRATYPEYETAAPNTDLPDELEQLRDQVIAKGESKT